MKLLVLGNSSFLPRKGIKEEELIQNQRDPVAETIVSGVELPVRIAWPTERLPDLVEEWVAETQPDAILFIINEFWFNYRSTPALMDRRFGPFGRPLAKAGAWAGRNRHLAYSRAFQKARRYTSERVGGDAFFEPDQVIDVSLEVLRRIMRAEGPVPLVVGPMGGMDHMLPEALQPEGQARRMKVHSALKQFCGSHHIEYWSMEHEVFKNMPQTRRSTLPDGIHSDAQGVKQTLSYWAPLVARFLKKVKEEQDAAKQQSLP